MVGWNMTVTKWESDGTEKIWLHEITDLGNVTEKINMRNWLKKSINIYSQLVQYRWNSRFTADNCAGWRKKATLTSDHCPHSLLAALLSGSSSVVLVDSVRLDPSMNSPSWDWLGYAKFCWHLAGILGWRKGNLKIRESLEGSSSMFFVVYLEGTKLTYIWGKGAIFSKSQVSLFADSIWVGIIVSYSFYVLFDGVPRFFIPFSLIQGLWSFHSKFLVFLFASFTHGILPVYVL